MYNALLILRMYAPSTDLAETDLLVEGKFCPEI